MFGAVELLGNRFALGLCLLKGIKDRFNLLVSSPMGIAPGSKSSRAERFKQCLSRHTWGNGL